MSITVKQPKLIHCDTIEAIKQQADLVDIVAQYVTLQKRGKDYMGLCPFHEEKTPSFSVSPTKQFYHCFGCGVGGDAIHFLMKLNQNSFQDVVLELAYRYSIRVRYEDGSFDEDLHPPVRPSIHPRKRRPEPNYLPAPIPDGEIELATVTTPFTTPQRQRLPHATKPNVDTWVTRFLYSNDQWVDRIEWIDATKPKGYDKITLPYHIDCNGQTVNTKGSKPWLPYRWSEVLQHTVGKWVLGLEGETCVEIARLLQLVAFTLQGGSWSHATIHQLLIELKAAGIAGLFYFPDHDNAGRKKAEIIAQAAAQAGLPCIVLNPLEIWPQMMEKGDIVDWYIWARSIAMQPVDMTAHLVTVAKNTAVALREHQEQQSIIGGSGGNGGSRRTGGFGSDGNGSDGGDSSKPHISEVSLPERIRSILRRYDSESLQVAALMDLASSLGRPYSDIEKLARLVRLEGELASDVAEAIEPLRALLKTCRKRLAVHRYLAPHLADALVRAARAMPTAPEYLLNTLIPVSSSRIGVSSRVVIKPESGYIQPCIFWTGNVAHSGQAKTPPQALIMEALEDIEQQAREAYQQNLADWEASQDKNKQKKPIEPRRILNNVTMAQKIRIHGENPRGLLEYIDELVADFERHNQHKSGKGDDLQQELQLWGGKFGSYDRSDVRLYLRRTGISKTGTYQWDTLARLMADDVNFIQSGYMARFLLCSIVDAPDRKLDLLSPNQDTGLRDLLHRLYRQLEQLPEQDYLLSHEAKVLFQGLNHAIVDLEKEEPHFGLSLVYAKIESNAARLALWLHLVNAVVQGQQPSPVISGETMQAAIELAAFYLWQHKLIHAHNAPTRKLEGIFLKTQTLAEKLWHKGSCLTASFAKSRINSIKSWVTEKIRATIFTTLVANGFGRTEGEGDKIVYIPNPSAPNNPCDNIFTVGEIGAIGGELVIPPTDETTLNQVIQTSVGEIGDLTNTSCLAQTEELLSSLEEVITCDGENANFTNQGAETEEGTSDTAIGTVSTEPPTVGEEPSPPPDDDPTPPPGGQPFPRTERYEYQGQLGLWVLQIQFNSPTHASVTYTSPAPESTSYTQSLTVSDLIEVGQKSVKWLTYLETLLQQQRSSADTVAQNPSIAEPRFSYCGKQSASGLVEINGRRAQVQFIQPGQIVVRCCEEQHSKHPDLLYVKPMSGADDWQDGIAVRIEDLQLLD